jgi:microcystin-dependent protein
MFNQPFLGLVIPFAGKVPPPAWRFCNGQELPIYEYEELFSLIGTAFGGNGDTTFALPDLSERVAIHTGQGAQMQKHTAGATGGNETVLITAHNLPVHTHESVGKITGNPPCAGGTGSTSIPTGNYPANVNGGAAQYSTSASDTIVMGTATISAVTVEAPGVSGEKEAVYVMSPFLTMNYIICVQGAFPSHG